MRRLKKGLSLGGGSLLAFLLAVALFPGISFAHAHYQSSSPADGASLAQPPTSVTIHFTESIEPSLSKIEVLDASGQEVTAGAARPIDNNQGLQVPLRPSLSPGKYTVEWSNVATDGHALNGSFTFTVSATSTQGDVAQQHSLQQNPVSQQATAVSSTSTLQWWWIVVVVIVIAAIVWGILSQRRHNRHAQ
ncbi:MAG: copper resistance protein CopC [Firmicutes bacterium]|nr:copper resistance protein CopC [Bacillota bacterium]